MALKLFEESIMEFPFLLTKKLFELEQSRTAKKSTFEPEQS